jgi:hypothetical protein
MVGMGVSPSKGYGAGTSWVRHAGDLIKILLSVTPRPSERCSRPSRPAACCLLVHHAGMDIQQVQDSGFDSADYVWPPMVAALLKDDREV